MQRDEVIAHIRAELRRRSGRSWSVSGGRGTAWGWIRVTAPPKRRTGRFGEMTEADAAELGKLLGLTRPAWRAGENVPAQSDYYREYVARASGETPTVYGVPNWD